MRGTDGLDQLISYSHLEQLVESNTPVRSKKRRSLEACLADPDRLIGQHFPEMFRHSKNDPHDMRRACEILVASCAILHCALMPPLLLTVAV
jgi:hypothetical protein